MALLVLACSSSSPNGQDAIVPMAPSPPPQQVPFDAGCTKVPVADASTGDTSGCLAEWACSDKGLLTLACELDDAGARCACITDSDASTVDIPADPCAPPQDLAQIASEACGWKVP